MQPKPNADHLLKARQDPKVRVIFSTYKYNRLFQTQGDVISIESYVRIRTKKPLYIAAQCREATTISTRLSERLHVMLLIKIP
jgi:hypothetical protein